MVDLDLKEISKFIGFSRFIEMYVMLAGYLVRYYPFFMDMIAMMVLDAIISQARIEIYQSRGSNVMLW